MKKLKKLLVPVAILCVLATGCKKDKDNDPTPAQPSNPTFSSATNPEVGFKINGAAVAYKNGIGNIQQGLSTGASLGQPNNEAVQGAFLYQDIDPNTTRTWFNIDKGTLVWAWGNSLDSTQWKNFWAPGSYTYVAEEFNTATQQGVRISFEDSNDVYWSTIQGNADQTGSTFNITKSLFYMFWGEKYMKVQFTFNCKVYDVAGNMKTITDGSGVLDFAIEY